ncbi:hypothetical protein AVEN_51681-1 [Araneus ventricosus]|uniref:Uncharacterized protein n=1 Tax=Araneus ventricosus TaxID=182803 RepID=A0A4Y2A7V1_ARAVE|nr:hypothetical protein AVEN_51681-1 [Araneus ventricosus]
MNSETSKQLSVNSSKPIIHNRFLTSVFLDEPSTPISPPQTKTSASNIHQSKWSRWILGQDGYSTFRAFKGRQSKWSYGYWGKLDIQLSVLHYDNSERFFR